MENAFIEVVKASPYGAIIIAVLYLLLKAQKEERVERASNAKEKADADRSHDLEKNRLWAEMIKSISDDNKSSALTIARSVETMQKVLSDQYEKMGITRDLLDEARNALRSKK
jgi:hypothetical protein